MKHKLINAFKEWIAVMVLSIVTLLFMNVIMFFGGRTMGFSEYLLCIGAVTGLFIMVKILTPLINYIVRV